MLDRCLLGIAAVFLCLVSHVEPNTENMASAIDPTTTLECHRREYTFKATKTDFGGRKCWDYLRVMSCWGRCDTFEIPDWRFPYRKSFHPVCLHENTMVRRVALRHCDPGSEPDLRVFEYVEALSCTCHTCNTSTASCEAPHHMRRPQDPAVPLTPTSLSYLP